MSSVAMEQSIQYKINPSTTLNVLSSGTPSSKPSLIFLHFWGGSSRTFTPIVSSLNPQIHTLSIDFRGWGSSTGPPDPSAYSISTLASDIETLLPRLCLQDFILVGHSMGGKVAQLITGRNRVPGLKGLVLLAPAPPTPLELPQEMREQQQTAYSSAESAKFVVRNVLSSCSPPLPENTVKLLVEDMLKGNDFAREAWPSYGMSEDIVVEAREIDVPVLVVAGSLDRVETVERLRREVLGNVTGAVLVVVEGAGHLLVVERPREVAGYVERFLERVNAN
ncbi:Alpha/Beta hydrolase protein [Cadophora sp. MPI-SDFR-AT-0126]|nr:Alpha/Beta hydrolase protein [Leotiomycetes sp. MPI-SDFR-AT-0126]